jgi:hypothetical protein
MLVTYQAVPEQESAQTTIQSYPHIFEPRFPLGSKTVATGTTYIFFYFCSLDHAFSKYDERKTN